MLKLNMPKLFTTYVVEVFAIETMGSSQSMNDDDIRCMQLAKKHSKVPLVQFHLFLEVKPLIKNKMKCRNCF